MQISTSPKLDSRTQRFYDAFKERLAYKPRFSYDKCGSRQAYSRDDALQFPYVEPNNPNQFTMLVVDVDELDCGNRWEEQRLPAPNMIVFNKDNRKHHIVYFIDPVARHENAHSKPIHYFKAIESAYCAALKGDSRFTRSLMKNPFHHNYSTTFYHTHEYTLGHLAEHVVISTPSIKRTYGDVGRNVDLFNHLRHWGYRNVATMDRKTFDLKLLRLALEFNETFEEPLPEREVRSTHKSVERFCWTNRAKFGTDGCVNRGVMQLNPDVPLDARQRQSAERTNTLRTQTAIAKLVATRAQMEARGERVTIAALARATGLHRNTVSKIKKQLESASSEPVEKVHITVLSGNSRVSDAASSSDKLNESFSAESATAPEQELGNTNTYKEGLLLSAERNAEAAEDAAEQLCAGGGQVLGSLSPLVGSTLSTRSAKPMPSGCAQNSDPPVPRKRLRPEDQIDLFDG